MFLALFN